MKQTLCILTLGGLVAWSSAAIAQTNAPTPDAAATPSVTTTNDVAATTNAPSQAEEAKPAATLAAADATAQPAADTNAAPAAAVDTNAQPATAASDASAQTNAPAQPGAVIPLIVMDDVPLTDAIKNLARQAALNYIL